MLEMHVTGVAISSLTSGFLIALSLGIFLIRANGIGYSKDIARRLLHFVGPLIIASLGVFYVGYADKYFLRLFAGLDDVGLYVLAISICSVLYSLFEGFNTSWQADRFEVIKKSDAREVYEKMFRYLALFLFFMGGGIVIFTRDLLWLMSNPPFYLAAQLVPMLIFVSIFNALKLFCNFGALYTGKTKCIAHASWASALVSTVGCLALIPLMGVYGAVITAVLCNGVELIWIYCRSKKHYDMGLNWRPVAVMATTMSAFILGSLLIPIGEPVYLAMKIAMFFLMLGVFYRLPVWSASEKAAFIAFVLSHLSRLRKRTG